MLATARPRIAPKARLRWDRLASRWMLVYPDRGLALNATGGAILELCDGERTVAAIVDALAARTASSTSRERVEADVVAFLDGLAARGLVVTT